MTEFNDAAITAIAELARNGQQIFDHPQGGKAVLKPDGEVVHLQPVDKPLTHIKQKVQMLDTGSFVAYVNRFQDNGVTTIFGDYRAMKIRALIDYHSRLDQPQPGRLAHDVEFIPPWSEQWARWRVIDGKPQTQREFAEFIEENLQDVVTPEGAAFLDLVTGLQATKKVAFASGVRLHDGSNQLTYSEDVEARGKGTITFPSEFEIGVPLLFGGEAYRIRCLLRYRIDEGKLVFAVRVHRRLFLEQTAFNDVVAEVAKGTGLQVLLGAV